MKNIENSAIYVGEVVHQRHRPKRHFLRYRVFSVLIDLDELPVLNQLKHFGYNRRALFSFLDQDHGDGGELRAWVGETLRDAGFEAPGRVRVLCYPRLFGYVFNPLTVWYCDDKSGKPLAVIYEVHNTFHERHTYVIPADGARQSAEKAFYVSPFMDMDCVYNFRLQEPEERVLVAINETQNGEPLLYAAFSGERREFSDKSLFSLFFSHPLMTLKVTAAIYFEAVKLISKGIKIRWHTGRVKPSATARRAASTGKSKVTERL